MADNRDKENSPDSPKLEGNDNNKSDDITIVTTQDKKAFSKWQRIFRKLLVLPFFVGIAWTCLHPVVSILTGEAKCRGWYIDEHSLEYRWVNSAWTPPAHLQQVKLPSSPQSIHSLCDFNKSSETEFAAKYSTKIHCHSHAGIFSMMSITPLANAIDPVEEAVVFLVPAPPNNDWTTSTFHYSLLKSLEHLANPSTTPWLAKTLIVISPNAVNTSLQDTATAFLEAYLGPYEGNTPNMQQKDSTTTTAVPLLPPKLSGAILRNLIVLDIDDQSQKGVIINKKTSPSDLGKTHFAIVPQGRRGVLPNLDLVFLTGKLFQGTTFNNQRRFPQSTFLMHEYTHESQFASEMLRSSKFNLSSTIQQWARDLVNMGLFAYTMIQGPYPPHAPALDRGLDAITLQAKFQGVYLRDPAIEMVQYFEFLVRSLANLEERLHHSATLYLLPSRSTFVSHMEYFLPNVLILLPLAVRAFGLVLFEMENPLDLRIVGANLLSSFTIMGAVSIIVEITEDSLYMTNACLAVLYVTALIIWKLWSKGMTKNNEEKIDDDADDGEGAVDRQKEAGLYQRMDSLQFIACVSTVYILAPIAFAHTSLSYAPSILWTPLLAFGRYRNLVWSSSLRSYQKLRLVVTKMVLWIVWIGLSPPVLLVPYIFKSYTPFVQFAYVPIHLQLGLLLVMSTNNENHNNGTALANASASVASSTTLPKEQEKMSDQQ